MWPQYSAESANLSREATPEPRGQKYRSALVEVVLVELGQEVDRVRRRADQQRPTAWGLDHMDAAIGRQRNRGHDLDTLARARRTHAADAAETEALEQHQAAVGERQDGDQLDGDVGNVEAAGWLLDADWLRGGRWSRRLGGGNSLGRDRRRDVRGRGRDSRRGSARGQVDRCAGGQD